MMKSLVRDGSPVYQAGRVLRHLTREETEAGNPLVAPPAHGACWVKAQAKCQAPAVLPCGIYSSARVGF